MYWDILNELLHKDCLQQLKKFKQHRFTTTYEHCRHVAVMSYQLAEKWHITVNEKALAVFLRGFLKECGVSAVVQGDGVHVGKDGFPAPALEIRAGQNK